jgi:hypothetical protein
MTMCHNPHRKKRVMRRERLDPSLYSDIVVESVIKWEVLHIKL